MAIDPITGRADSASPLMVGSSTGMNRFWRNADGGASYTSDKTNIGGILALSAVTVATTSAALNTNSQGIELNVQFSDGVTTVDLQVFRVDPGPVDTLVKTFAGVNQTKADGLFVTPAEHVKLDGKQTKVRAQNFTLGTGSVTVKVKAT